MENINLIGIKQLAEILNKSASTIATEVSKAPHKLPPRTILPGSRKILWCEEDVTKWINSHREKET